MKAWLVHQWCEPEQMTFADVPTPEPGPRQVRIRNHAVALNFFDVLQICGKYQIKPPLPFTPGAEVAGIVDAVGSGVENVTPGMRVCGLPSAGAFAEYSLAACDRTFPIPGALSFPQAAAMPIVYHTSWFALDRRARLAAGEWVLVHAGASGVGMAAIQLSKALGARVIATASSQVKREFCLQQGADHAIDYGDPSWVDRVKEITNGHGADVIYDPVGGEVLELSTKCIAPEGRLLVVGFASGTIPSIAANRVLLKNMSLVGVFWGQYVSDKPGYLLETHERLCELFAANKINPVVGRTLPLSQAPFALRELADRKIRGKSVLVIP
jgi:NADPH2:quinone reductase